MLPGFHAAWFYVEPCIAESQKERKTQRRSRLGPQIRTTDVASRAPRNPGNPTKPPPQAGQSSSSMGVDSASHLEHGET